MSTISAGLVNVTNLTVTGTQSGAVTATNFNFTNLDLSGNLTVGGQLTAPNYSLEQLIDYQNLAWRQQFDISDIYLQSFAQTRSQARAENVCLYQALKYNAECEYTILDDSGNPTSLLTSATDWTNPKEHDFYDNPSQIVKIEDNGSLSYIDVSGTSITDLCKSMIPTNLKTFKTGSSSWSKYINIRGDGEPFTLQDVQDAHIQFLSWNLKMGIPTQNTSSSHKSIFYNMLFELGEAGTPLFGQNNMSIGIDLNPLIDGSGSIDFYIQGGISRQVALATPGIDWTGQVTVPPFSIAVTTNAAEYIQKKANGENSVYLNEVLNMLNMNIVDFGDYKSYFPNGNYWDTSGTPVPDSSNSTISSPVSFSCSFGMFRNSVESTSTTDTLLVVSDPNISYTNFDGKKPVQCPLAQVQYFVQVSDTLDFTFNISTLVGLQIVSINRTNIINGVDHCTSFLLPVYGIADSVNAYFQESRWANEHIGIPYTNGANVGDNTLTPYLDEVYGTNGISQVGYGNNNLIITDFSGLPDSQELINSSGTYNDGSLCTRIGNFMHEQYHDITFSVGVSSNDLDNNIIDDEYFLASMLNMMYNGLFKDTSGNVTRSMYQGLDASQDIFQYLTQGADVPFIQNHGTNYPLTTYGTNLSSTLIVNTAGIGLYALSTVMQSMISSYDLNMQHFKLMMYYYAKKLSYAKNYNIIGLYYKNHGVDVDYTQKTANPSICTGSFKQAIEGAHLHYSDGALIANASQLWMETFIMNILLRNNTSIPEKYRSNFTYSWYRSTHSPCDYGFGNSTFDIPSLNMASWDMSQTNEDTNASENGAFNNSVVPWWPKIISPAGANAYGEYLNQFDPSGNMTQDTTYRGICENVNAFTSNITRHMWSLGGFSYALTNDITSVTATLTEPDTSGTYGDYNTDISVAVVKYIPECCVTGVRNSKGAFLMKGPYTLSGTGDSKVIDLSGTFVNSPGSKFIVSTDSTDITAGMMSFDYVFPHGVDGSGTIYTPPEWSLARGAELGMVGNDVYQPVTYLVVINKQIDDFEFDDADVTEKLFLEQLIPSCVNISVTQV